jgi:uncharacterized membrane protein YwzB
LYAIAWWLLQWLVCDSLVRSPGFGAAMAQLAGEMVTAGLAMAVGAVFVLLGLVGLLYGSALAVVTVRRSASH